MSECRNSLITVKNLCRTRRLTKKQALVFECQRFSCRVLQVSDSLCWIKVLPLWAKALWQKHLESNTKQEQQQKRKQQFKKIFIWTLTDSGVSYPANHALWATQKQKCLQQSSTQVTDLIIETALWQTKAHTAKMLHNPWTFQKEYYVLTVLCKT